MFSFYCSSSTVFPLLLSVLHTLVYCTNGCPFFWSICKTVYTVGCSGFLNIQSVTPEDSFSLDSFLSLPSRADLGRALWLFRLIRAGSVSLEGTTSPLRLRPPASLQARMGKLWLYHPSLCLSGHLLSSVFQTVIWASQPYYSFQQGLSLFVFFSTHTHTRTKIVFAFFLNTYFIQNCIKHVNTFDLLVLFSFYTPFLWFSVIINSVFLYNICETMSISKDAHCLVL